MSKRTMRQWPGCEQCAFWSTEQLFRAADHRGWCSHHSTITWASGECGDIEFRKAGERAPSPTEE